MSLIIFSQISSSLYPIHFIVFPYVKASKAKARAAALEALMTEVQEGVAAKSRLRFSALRIARAWIAYRGSSERSHKILKASHIQVGHWMYTRHFIAFSEVLISVLMCPFRLCTAHL